jgi:hypothetical protein
MKCFLTVLRRWHVEEWGDKGLKEMCSGSSDRSPYPERESETYSGDR